MNTFVVLLTVIAAGYLAFGLKVVKENERFAETVLGRFTRLVGPGVVMKLGGGMKTWTKIALGQEGRFLGDGVADFAGSALPVQGERMAVGNTVMIESFREGRVWVTDRGTRSRTVVCEKCGHATKVSA